MISQSPCNQVASDARKPVCRRKWLAIPVGLLLSIGLTGGIFLLWRQINPPGPPRHTLVPESQNQGVTAEFFSPDSKFLVTGMARSGKVTLSVWDVEKKVEMRSIEMPPRGFHSVSMSGRGDLLAVVIGGPSYYSGKERKDGDKPREVRLYSFPDLKEVGKIESERYISSAVLSPDGKLLATVSQKDFRRDDDQITIWTVATRKPVYVLADIAAVGDKGAHIRFSPDGKKVAHTHYKKGKLEQGGAYSAIQEFEADSGKPLQLVRDESDLDFFEYFPDGKRLLVNQVRSDRILVHDIATGESQEIYKWKPRTGHAAHALVSADGKWVVYSLDERNLKGGTPMTPTIVIWDVETSKIHARWTVPEIKGAYAGIYSMALSPDKKTLAVGASGLHLFEVPQK